VEGIYPELTPRILMQKLQDEGIEMTEAGERRQRDF